jgi:beta-mannosidase
MSETAMHNIPEARSMREVVSASEFVYPLANMYSPEFAYEHPDFRHHFGEFDASRVPRMFSRASQIDDMRAPTIESLSEASQIGAGEFYQIVSEQMQALAPNVSGLIPWVYKRPWPIIAIMLADGFGQPTAPYYFLKRTYQNTHVALNLAELIWAPGERVSLKARPSTPRHSEQGRSPSRRSMRVLNLFGFEPARSASASISAPSRFRRACATDSPSLWPNRTIAPADC